MIIRIAAVSALSAALIAGGATAAIAAPAPHPVAAKPAPHPVAPTPVPHPVATTPAPHPVAPTPSISIAASSSRVAVRDSVTFSGSTTNLQKGSTVTLQELIGGTWVARGTGTVNHGNSYSINNSFGTKGLHTLNVVDGTTVSSSINVYVR
jgi:hypothetical protein